MIPAYVKKYPKMFEPLTIRRGRNEFVFNNRVMMAPMARKVARDRTEDPTALAMKEAFAHGGDWVSPEDLGPVLDWLRRG